MRGGCGRLMGVVRKVDKGWCERLIGGGAEG